MFLKGVIEIIFVFQISQICYDLKMMTIVPTSVAYTVPMRQNIMQNGVGAISIFYSSQGNARA